MVQCLGRYVIPCSILLLLTLSCSQTPVPPAKETCVSPSSDLKNSLVGTWLSDEIIVGIDTINNSGNSVLLEINKEEYQEKLKLRPIQTVFHANKTYVSAYCTTEGKIIRVTAGKWTIEKNKLNIHQLFPSDQQLNYRIDLSAGYAQLRSQLDFDGDGNSDDMFYCQMKKIG